MIIYWSMIFWVPFVYLIYEVNRKRKENRVLAIYGKPQMSETSVFDKVPISYALAVFGYFTFWIGMRGAMMDTWAYIEDYRNLPADFFEGWKHIDWDGKSPGFEIFNLFFKDFISEDYQWWLMAIAIISMVCVMVPLRKYSPDFFFGSFIFVALTTFSWPMNGMRQFICVAVLFACSDWIKDGKFIRFTIVAWLLSSVHYTSLIMIAIYFVVRSKPWQIRVFFFIIAMALACVFAEPLFAGLEDTVLSGTEYSGATAQFAADDGVNPLRALFYAAFPLLAYFRRKSLEPLYETHPMLPIAINMSLMTVALYVVGVFTSGILIGRLPIYCSLYNMILIPYIIKFGFNDKDRKIVRAIAVVYLMVMFWLECPGYYMSEMTGYIF